MLAQQYHSKFRLVAVACAQRVAHHVRDPRITAAIDVAERHARGEAWNFELATARNLAWQAVQEYEAAAGVYWTTRPTARQHAMIAAASTAAWSDAYAAEQSALNAKSAAARARTEAEYVDGSSHWGALWDRHYKEEADFQAAAAAALGVGIGGPNADAA